MMAVTKYHCPACDRTYDSYQEAAACYKSPRGRFKPGDIVWDGYASHVYRIVDVPEHGIDGASVEPVQELAIAAALYRPEKEQCFIVGGFWCKAEKYPVTEAKKLVKELERRLDAAHKFLDQVSETEPLRARKLAVCPK